MILVINTVVIIGVVVSVIIIVVMHDMVTRLHSRPVQV